MDEHTTIESRIAHCRERDTDDYEHVVHGVAQGADELTYGLNSPKFWPAAELKTAAPTLEGQTVYKVHGDGEREEVGTVLRAGYQADLGVVYEAGIDDAEIAEELVSGQRQVSIEAGNPSEVDRHEETGAVIMRDYEYTGLATPKKGASDANYTAPGSADDNPAVAALSAADLEGVLNGDDVDVDAALNAYRSVSGVRFRARRSGKLDKDALPNEDGEYQDHYLFDRDTASASSYPVVDADGYLRRGNVAAAYSVGPRGEGVTREDLYEKLRPLNAAFDTPPIEPEKLRQDTEAEMAALAADLDTGAVLAAQTELVADTDDPTGARPSGRDTDDSTDTDATGGGGSDSMTDDNNDLEALLERVDQKEDEIDSLEAELEATEEELEAKEEQIAELEEQEEERIAELEEENEELREQNEAAREQYAAALAEADTVFDEEELAERYSLAELSEKVEEADFSTDDASTEPFVRSGGGGADETAKLSASEQERKAELEAELEEKKEKEGPLAEKEVERIEAELAEITGGEA